MSQEEETNNTTTTTTPARRQLDVLESMFSISNALRAWSFVNALGVQGPLTETILESALRLLIRRYPMLRMRIVSKPEEFVRHFEEIEATEFINTKRSSYLRTIIHNNNNSSSSSSSNDDGDNQQQQQQQSFEQTWKDAFEGEFVSNYDEANGPLWRVTLVSDIDSKAQQQQQQQQQNVIVFALHHSIGDATSIMYVFRDLLRFCNQIAAAAAAAANNNNNNNENTIDEQQQQQQQQVTSLPMPPSPHEVMSACVNELSKNMTWFSNAGLKLKALHSLVFGMAIPGLTSTVEGAVFDHRGPSPSSSPSLAGESEVLKLVQDPAYKNGTISLEEIGRRFLSDAEVQKRRPRVHCVTIDSPEVLRGLTQQCRAHGTTVNGALTAAALFAMYDTYAHRRNNSNNKNNNNNNNNSQQQQQQPWDIRFATNINLRRFATTPNEIERVKDNLCSLAAAHSLKYRIMPHPKRSSSSSSRSGANDEQQQQQQQQQQRISDARMDQFWKIAKKSKEDLHKLLEDQVFAKVSTFFIGSGPKSVKMMQQAILKNALDLHNNSRDPRDLFNISNIGYFSGFDGVEPTGTTDDNNSSNNNNNNESTNDVIMFKPTSHYWSASFTMTGVSYGVNATSFGGKMHLSIPYTEPIVSTESATEFKDNLLKYLTTAAAASL